MSGKLILKTLQTASDYLKIVCRIIRDFVGATGVKPWSSGNGDAASDTRRHDRRGRIPAAASPDEELTAPANQLEAIAGLQALLALPARRCKFRLNCQLPLSARSYKVSTCLYPRHLLCFQMF